MWEDVKRKLLWWHERLFGEYMRKMIEKLLSTEFEYISNSIEKALNSDNAFLAELLQAVCKLLETVSNPPDFSV
jgi:hypothetical protein